MLCLTWRYFYQKLPSFKAMYIYSIMFIYCTCFLYWSANSLYLVHWGDSQGPQLSASGRRALCWPPSVGRHWTSPYRSLEWPPPLLQGLSYSSTTHRSTCQKSSSKNFSNPWSNFKQIWFLKAHAISNERNTSLQWIILWYIHVYYISH